MKILLVILLVVSCNILLANDISLHQSKTEISVDSLNGEVINLHIDNASLEKFVVIFHYEYWGELCLEYEHEVNPLFEDDYQYGKRANCIDYTKKILPAQERIVILKKTKEAHSLQVKLQKRGFELDVSLLDDKMREKRLKRNIWGSYKIKI